MQSDIRIQTVSQEETGKTEVHGTPEKENETDSTEPSKNILKLCPLGLIFYLSNALFPESCHMNLFILKIFIKRPSSSHTTSVFSQPG